MEAVGLFEAKTHLSEYVARAEAGEEVIIMRHNKPVAKIVPLAAASPEPLQPIPRFVQRSFDCGPFLTDEANMNRLASDLEDVEFLRLTARLEREAAERAARPGAGGSTMRLPDTNLLVYSIEATTSLHAPARRWMEDAFNGTAPVGLAWLALVGFVRIATRPGILKNPLPVDDALAVLDDWVHHPNARILQPTERHAGLLARLLSAAGTAGNLTNDAHLAALAIEHAATIGTFDKDFKRFPGLRLDFLTA